MSADSSRLERLVALRAIHEALMAEGLTARDAAAVSREYRATLAEIDELAPKTEIGDPVDEIAQRRAARRPSSAKNQARAKRPS